jgi:hypothetical protein
MTLKLLLLTLFAIWSFPFGYYRLRFRKIVYRDPSWTIAIKPYFIKETVALFGNSYPDDKEYIQSRNFYRVYLIVYLILLALLLYI